MSRTWEDARCELDCWARRGLKARFWVRDDDASEMSAPLARLHDLATSYEITIGLAVIPGKVQPSLLQFMNDEEHRFHAMCHGWQHINYAPRGRTPAEFGHDRPMSALIHDAKLAFSTFREYLTDSHVVFVPPFGQISRSMIRALPGVGFTGMSGGAGWLERRLSLRMPSWFNVPRLDVHIDPINWRRRTAHSADTICDALVRCLRQRRIGFLSSDAPIGLLTHHLAHDEKVWAACNDILDFLRHHRAVEFLDVGQFFEATARVPND
jgi:hypothetical protein